MPHDASMQVIRQLTVSASPSSLPKPWYARGGCACVRSAAHPSMPMAAMTGSRTPLAAVATAAAAAAAAAAAGCRPPPLVMGECLRWLPANGPSSSLLGASARKAEGVKGCSCGSAATPASVLAAAMLSPGTAAPLPPPAGCVCAKRRGARCRGLRAAAGCGASPCCNGAAAAPALPTAACTILWYCCSQLARGAACCGCWAPAGVSAS